MRLISGKYKSRRIQVPANLKARPTTDFAREGLFNVLSNMIDWEDVSNALDLFSGTGSIAFEFVSRGCQNVVCVEQSALHYNFICKTKDSLKAQELTPIRGDMFKYVQMVNQKFNLIFADPPYDLPKVDEVPKMVLENRLLHNGGIFVMEHSKKHNFSHLPYFVEERKYGNVHFSFFEMKE